MSTAALAPRGASSLPSPARRRTSLRSNRRWALITSYVFLTIFAIFFLIPPYYMIVTALKSDAEVAHMATNPWIIADGVTGLLVNATLLDKGDVQYEGYVRNGEQTLVLNQTPVSGPGVQPAG